MGEKTLLLFSVWDGLRTVLRLIPNFSPFLGFGHALGVVLSQQEVMCVFLITAGFSAGRSLPIPGSSAAEELLLAHSTTGHRMCSPSARAGLVCTSWSAADQAADHQAWESQHTHRAGCCGSLSLVTCSWDSLVLACSKLALPVCHGMQSILFFLFLGGFWHLKASSFVTREPQMISSFMHVPLTVLCLVSWLCCVYLKSGLLYSFSMVHFFLFHLQLKKLLLRTIPISIYLKDMGFKSLPNISKAKYFLIPHDPRGTRAQVWMYLRKT